MQVVGTEVLMQSTCSPLSARTFCKVLKINGLHFALGGCEGWRQRHIHPGRGHGHGHGHGHGQGVSVGKF